MDSKLEITLETKLDFPAVISIDDFLGPDENTKNAFSESGIDLKKKKREYIEKYLESTGYRKFIEKIGTIKKVANELNKHIGNYYSFQNLYVNAEKQGLLEKISHAREKIDENLEKIVNWITSFADQSRENQKELIKEAVRFCLDKHKYDKMDMDEGYFGKHPVISSGILFFLGFDGYLIALGLIHDTAEDNIKKFEKYLNAESCLQQNMDLDQALEQAGIKKEEYYDLKNFLEIWKGKPIRELVKANGNAKRFFEEINSDNFDSVQNEVKSQFLDIYRREFSERIKKNQKISFSESELESVNLMFQRLKYLTRIKGESYKAYEEKMSDKDINKQVRDGAMIVKLGGDTIANILTTRHYPVVKKVQTFFKALLVRDNATNYLDSGIKEEQLTIGIMSALEMEIALTYTEVKQAITEIEKRIKAKYKNWEEILNENTERIDSYTREGGFHQSTKEKNKLTPEIISSLQNPESYKLIDWTLFRTEIFLKKPYKLLPYESRIKDSFKEELNNDIAAHSVMLSYLRLCEYYMFYKIHDHNFKVEGLRSGETS